MKPKERERVVDYLSSGSTNAKSLAEIYRNPKVEVPRLLSVKLEDYREDNKKLQLWRRQEGFDVIVIINDKVFSVEFIAKFDLAKERYNELKQQYFNTKEEEW